MYIYTHNKYMYYIKHKGINLMLRILFSFREYKVK